ncbi:MAG: GntR family transcriptional regulator [Microbacteriaceae bacterium]|nr:GntR family transcriptional regulator [Microbacteriaceae bacterium]
MINLDKTSATPPFEQIKLQLREQIQAGSLVAGAHLPTVRKLAAELGLAAGTVARAYKELEDAGFIVTRGRAGTTVADGDDAVRQQAHAAALAFAQQMKRLGLPWDEAAALAHAAYLQS